jgi:hypothetical protein
MRDGKRSRHPAAAFAIARFLRFLRFSRKHAFFVVSAD